MVLLFLSCLRNIVYYLDVSLVHTFSCYDQPIQTNKQYIKIMKKYRPRRIFFLFNFLEMRLRFKNLIFLFFF